MARVYSTRFISEAGVTAFADYTVPAGFRAVLRDVWVYAGSQITTVDFQLFSGTGAVMWSIGNPPLNPAFWFWQGRQVYEEGEAIGFQVHAGNVDYSASGYLLDLP